jgi:DNA modification methylase
VWEIALRDGSGETTHGTQKPVECMARPMRNHHVRDVYEPFSGSGSTLMAAEGLGKRAFAMELTPTYVQQAIDRWEAHTGKTATRL